MSVEIGGVDINIGVGIDRFGHRHGHGPRHGVDTNMDLAINIGTGIHVGADSDMGFDINRVVDKHVCEHRHDLHIINGADTDGYGHRQGFGHNMGLDICMVWTYAWV